jgi:rRNA maturation endonuclease Nob1
MVGYVNETPTEDVKHIVYGEWIDCGLYVYECSNCYNSLEMWWEDKYKFCPNCGANMRKEQPNEK